MQLGARVALAVFFSACTAALAPAQRLRNSLGPATFTVTATPAGEVVTFPAGFVFAASSTDLGRTQAGAKNGRNKWNTGPCQDGLAVAISAAYQYRPTAAIARLPVVEVNGRVRAVYVGGVGQAGSTGVAYWPGNTPITCAVVGAPSGGEILGVSVGGALGGIERLILCGLTILGPPGSSSAVTVYQGTNTGRLALWECTIEPADPRSWGGHGTKWPIRAHGHLNGRDGPLNAWTDYSGSRTDARGDGIGGGIEVVDCTIWPGQEHAYAYVDNIGPNSRFVGIKCHPNYDRSLWVERTLVQVTNRSNPAGVTAGGPSGYGSLEIADIESVRCGGDPALGGPGDGYAITVAGHLGPVNIHGLVLRDYHGGAVVCWTDANPIKGYWRFPNGGFTVGAVTLANLDCESAINTNPALAFGGCRSITVGAFRLKGRNAAIDVDNSYVGPVKCGPLRFQLGELPSAYAGFQSASKVRRNNLTLTSAQLDALVVP